MGAVLFEPTGGLDRLINDSSPTHLRETTRIIDKCNFKKCNLDLARALVQVFLTMLAVQPETGAKTQPLVRSGTLGFT